MSREATDLAGVRHLAYETLGSTNAEALSRARAGERGPLWITARTQTSGRGRYGRTWVSLAGNLHATLLLTEPSVPAKAPQLSLVAALAVHDAVAESVAHLASRLALKWPNDLLLDGGKAAGILIEGESEPVFAVAIGIGVNCAAHPEGGLYPATDLAEAGGAVSADAVMAELAAAMCRRLSQWNRGHDFACIRAEWLERTRGLGETLKVRLADRELSGRFQGLDEFGRLLLENQDGIIAVATGDVFGLDGR